MSNVSKRYRCKNSDTLLILLDVKGQRREIRFGGADRYMNIKGSYTTREKSVQDALEALPTFGVDFVLERSAIVDDYRNSLVDKKIKEDMKNAKAEQKVLHFEKINDCKTFLATTYGVKPNLITSRAKAIEIAKEFGHEVEFTER